MYKIISVARRRNFSLQEYLTMYGRKGGFFKFVVM